MRTFRRWVPVIVGVLLSACSSGEGTDEGAADASSARGILTAAPGKTIDAGSARVDVHAALEGQTRGTLDGEGALEFETEKGRLEVDLRPLGLAGGGRTEVLLDRDVIYIKLGQSLPGLGQRPWVKIDLDALSEGQGDSIPAFRQLRANDPSAVLNSLRGVTGEVTEVGKEEVRGTTTTRYRATVDLEKAAASSPDAVRDDVAEVMRQLGTERLPVEAWIDGEGRLSRLRYTLDLAELDDEAPAKGTGTGSATTTLELYEFGVDVAVAVPPADQTTDLADLLGGLD